MVNAFIFWLGQDDPELLLGLNRLSLRLLHIDLGFLNKLREANLSQWIGSMGTRPRRLLQSPPPGTPPSIGR